MTDNLFQPETPETVITPAEITPELIQSVATKYNNDPAALAQAKANADNHIQRLEAENKAMRDNAEVLRQKATEGVSMQQFLEKLAAAQPKETPAPQGSDQGNKGVTTEAVTELVSKELQRISTADRMRQNRIEVRTELKKALGSDYTTKIAERAKELGYSEAEFDQLAATKPTAFLQLALPGKPPTEQPVRVPPSSVNTTNFQHTSGQKDKAYFDKLRSTNFSLWSSVEVQNQLMEEASKNPNFYPGN